MEVTMIGLNPDCPPSVTLLADHLDAALAAGEDLMASMLAARSDLDEVDPEAAPEALDDFVRRLMKLESALLLRMLQARRLAVELGRVDGTLKSAGVLFKAQTDVLEALIFQAGRAGATKLTRPGDGHAYLRSRGLIAPEAAAPSPFECVAVSEMFRIGGVAPLGLMLDLVSSLLDLLDARFGLYAPDAAGEPVEADGERPMLTEAVATGADTASGKDCDVGGGAKAELPEFAAATDSSAKSEVASAVAAASAIPAGVTAEGP